MRHKKEMGAEQERQEREEQREVKGEEGEGIKGGGVGRAPWGSDPGCRQEHSLPTCT